MITILAAFCWMGMFTLVHTWDRTEHNLVLARERKNVLQILIGSMMLLILAMVISSLN